MRFVTVFGFALLLVLSLGSFAGGVWLGSDLHTPHLATHQSDVPVEDEDRFVIARVGEVVGRLKTLESDLLALQQMMDQQRVLHGQLSALDPTLHARPQVRPEWRRQSTATAGAKR